MSSIEDVLNFIILTHPKSGSTTLANVLKSHPYLCLPFGKETFFWDQYFDKGIAWYLNSFPSCKKRIRGEVCTHGLISEKYISNILSSHKRIKVIILKRNSLERAISHYNHNIRIGLENLSLKDAINREDIRLSDGKKITTYGYFNLGLLASENYKRIINSIPQKQILYVQTENLKDNWDIELEKIQSFLEIPVIKIKYKEENVARYSNYSQNLQRLFKLPLSLITYIHESPTLKVITPKFLKISTRKFRWILAEAFHKFNEKKYNRKLPNSKDFLEIDKSIIKKFKKIIE